MADTNTVLTAKEIYDLNNMNVAAQNVNLGTLLEDLLERVATLEEGGEEEEKEDVGSDT